MKKSLLLASGLLGVLALVSCGNNSNSEEVANLRILCPVGAPAAAFYNYSENSNFKTNSKPAEIAAEFVSDDFDVIVLDTTTGIKQINNGADFSLAANITFGNFYIASTGNDDNNTMDAGDTIVLFGKTQTPDLVFHYLYGTTYDEGIEYVAAATDAAKALAAGKNVATGSTADYVFLAEPALYTILHNESAKTYGKASVFENIQDTYVTKSNGLEMVQASVFIRNTVDKKTTKAFLSSLESDIKKATESPAVVEEGMNKIESEAATSLYGAAPAIFKAVLSDNNSIGLGYKSAYSNKDAIDAFISLFGMEKTDEKIYYR